MKIIIRTFDSIIEIIANKEIISSNNIIDTLSTMVKIDKNNIILLYNNILIKYMINKQYINENSIFFMIIQPYFLS
jgi:hypothetical protein